MAFSGMARALGPHARTMARARVTQRAHAAPRAPTCSASCPPSRPRPHRVDSFGRALPHPGPSLLMAARQRDAIASSPCSARSFATTAADASPQGRSDPDSSPRPGRRRRRSKDASLSSHPKRASALHPPPSKLIRSSSRGRILSQSTRE